MPIREYECPECGHRWESMERSADAPAKECPDCGSPKVVRLISRTSFRLRGGGWASDGYSKEVKR